MATYRYTVAICFANYRPPMKAFPISIEHAFTSKIAAESFAEAISHYLPARDEAIEEGMPLAWVLVSALATTYATRVSIAASHCYLSFDPGGVVVKRHPINAGFYGARCVTCHVSREAA